MLGGIQITLCILLGMQPAQDSWKLQGKYFKRFQGFCVRMSHGHLARWMGSWTTIWRPGCNKFANIQQELSEAVRISWVSMVSISDAYFRLVYLIDIVYSFEPFFQKEKWFNKIKSGCKNPNSWCQPVLHNELWEIEVSQEFVLKLMEKVWSTKFLLTEDPSRLGMKTFSWSFIAGPSLFSRSYIYIFPFFSSSKTSVRPWQVSAKCCGWDRRKNAVKEKLFFVKSIFFFLGRFLHTSGKSGQ